MKKQDILPLLKLLSVPVLLILLGLVLVVNPDAASVMIATVVGYVLIAGAVIGGVAAVVSDILYIRHSQPFEHGKLVVVICMISYEPFYKTLFKKNITEYNLIYKQGFSANTLHRIKQGKHISTKTLDALCDALDCRVEDIIRFEKE